MPTAMPPEPDDVSSPGASSAPRGAASGLMAWLTGQVDLERSPRLGTGRIFAAAVSAVLMAALLGWGLPLVTGASWSGILETVRSAPAWTLPAMILLGAAALALEALTVRTAVRGSRYPDALQGHAAATATSLAIPGGGVIGTLLLGVALRRSGLAMRPILTGVVTASLVELAVSTAGIPLLGLAAYGLAALLGMGTITLPGGIGAAVVAVLLALLSVGALAMLLRRSVLEGVLEQSAQVIGLEPPSTSPIGLEPPSASPQDERDDQGRGASPLAAILQERDELVGLLRRRPLALIGPTALARALQLLALALAIQAAGASVPLLLVVAIFALGRVLAMVPLTPGGTGIAEAVGAAALIGLGVAAESAASAVLLLAIATVVMPLVLGAAGVLLTVLRRGGRRPRP